MHISFQKISSWLTVPTLTGFNVWAYDFCHILNSSDFYQGSSLAMSLVSLGDSQAFSLCILLFVFVKIQELSPFSLRVYQIH